MKSFWEFVFFFAVLLSAGTAFEVATELVRIHDDDMWLAPMSAVLVGGYIYIVSVRLGAKMIVNPVLQILQACGLVFGAVFFGSIYAGLNDIPVWIRAGILAIAGIGLAIKWNAEKTPN
jgi:uncharacterized membrane protein YjjP (DUF1212 family)